MRVLCIIGAHKDYVRSRMNVQVLQKSYDVRVISSTANTYLMRYVSVFFQFLLCKKSPYDFVFISFLAQPLMPFIKLLYRKTIICDAFISLYDTLCLDRARFSENGLLAYCIKRFEKFSLSLADYIVTDTKAYRKYYHELYGILKEKIKVLYLGAPPEFFKESLHYRKTPDDSIEVLYYGTGLPLHGFDVVLKAAHQLRDQQIKFTLIGPFQKKFSALINELNLSNCVFIPWVSASDLPTYIEKADICLAGHFGNTLKAKRVIPGKAYQFAAMGKPMILGFNLANQEVFTHNTDCIMVQMNDERALAKAILGLAKNKNERSKIGTEARECIDALQRNTNYLLSIVLLKHCS